VTNKLQGMRQLPPLASLRGFEAAARHLSFRDAAQELHLTQGAISRQIQALELSLGTLLFVRKTRQVQLTKAGSSFFQVVRAALDMLEHATVQMKRTPLRKTLVLSALPTLTSIWIMPRLHEFTERHPNIDVRLVTSLDPVDLLEDHIDLAIRVGQLPGSKVSARHLPRIEHSMVESWAGVRADELFPDVLVPVCASSLLGRNRIRSAKDLLRYPLIHTTTRRFAWMDWLKGFGISGLPRSSGNLEFGHFFMSIEAALRGQGIAIIPRIILSMYKDASRLHRPIDATVPSAGSYYLLVPEAKLTSPEVAALHAWLLSEARALSALA